MNMKFQAIVAATACLMAAGFAQAADAKPNIVVIWGDDIGQSNVSAGTVKLT